MSNAIMIHGLFIYFCNIYFNKKQKTVANFTAFMLWVTNGYKQCYIYDINTSMNFMISFLLISLESRKIKGCLGRRRG